MNTSIRVTAHIDEVDFAWHGDEIRITRQGVTLLDRGIIVMSLDREDDIHVDLAPRPLQPRFHLPTEEEKAALRRSLAKAAQELQLQTK